MHKYVAMHHELVYTSAAEYHVGAAERGRPFMKRLSPGVAEQSPFGGEETGNEQYIRGSTRNA